jgi:hypothetical protein
MGRTEIGEITSQALANSLIGDSAKRRFLVYVPPGYETSDEGSPVVYALHGWQFDYEQLDKMVLQLNSLIDEGEARPMILVYPDGGNAYKGSWYQSSPTIGPVSLQTLSMPTIVRSPIAKVAGLPVVRWGAWGQSTWRSSILTSLVWQRQF